jgi:hypothetical protein
MKKLLITATLFITALTALAPLASARDLVLIGYDRVGRPVYREVSRPAPRYYEDRYSSYSEPRVRYHSHDDDCRPAKQPKHRSPLAFLFNF